MGRDVPMVCCGCCRGTGLVPLADEYRATLAALRRYGREVTGAELGRAMGVKATAMNNRLAAIERHGLAVSRVSGRKRLFRVREGS